MPAPVFGSQLYGVCDVMFEAIAHHVDAIEAYFVGDPGAEAIVDSGRCDEIFCLKHLSEFCCGGHSRGGSIVAIAVVTSHTGWRLGLLRFQGCFNECYESMAG